ncbi:MAG: VWA domain-containing protein [Deltaproteobacteria bacterium]|nr:VWA domain-containing protein [Deltaproteobacteria bacterium]
MRSARVVAAVLAVLAGAAAGCSPADDEGNVGDGRPRDDGGGGADADADADADPESGADADPDVDREIPDYEIDSVCGAEDLPLEYAVSSDVLIVLDRSGSMMLTLNPLKNAVRTIVDATDDRIWFGLMPFPSSVPPNACRMIAPATECAAPDHPQVEPGAVRFPDIDAALGADLGICGSTPTSATMRNVASWLRSNPTGHTQYALLVTDGVPNCNSSLDDDTCTCLDTETGCSGRPEACLDDTATYAAIDGLLADGVLTYVMALGRWAGSDRDVLNDMAVHGGTGHFYAAEDTGAILGTFEEIMGTIVVSCIFDLHPGDTVDPTQVNLYVGDDVVPRDPAHGNGWDYLDEDTVEFYGPACEGILSGDVTAVRAAYGCPTVLL